MIPSNSEIWPWKIVLCLIHWQKGKTEIKYSDRFWNSIELCDEGHLQNLKISINFGK